MKFSFFPKEFPTIMTSRLVLRQPRQMDEDTIFRLYSDTEIVRYIMPPVSTPAEAYEILQAYINDFYSRKRIFWTIALKENNVSIGTCCYEEFASPGIGEIGYDLLPAYQGKGYMREALTAIIQYGFSILQLDEIEAFVSPGNQRSMHLLQKLGFQLAGRRADDDHYLLTYQEI